LVREGGRASEDFASEDFAFDAVVFFWPLEFWVLLARSDLFVPTGYLFFFFNGLAAPLTAHR
jgi:hypothetical protein